MCSNNYFRLGATLRPLAPSCAVLRRLAASYRVLGASQSFAWINPSCKGIPYQLCTILYNFQIQPGATLRPLTASYRVLPRLGSVAELRVDQPFL